MKILNLLEGSEVLFHGTSFHNFKGMTKSGGMVCSILDDVESERVHKRLGILGRLFYLSTARNIHSGFILQMVKGYPNVVVFEINGRALSKYGKVLPFNYFNHKDPDYAEMEDRLISDKNKIPFSSDVFSAVRIVCKDSDKEIVEEFKTYGIPMKFYASGSDLLLNKRPRTFEERFAEVGEPEEIGEIAWNVPRTMEFMKQVIKYLDGEMPDNTDMFAKQSKDFSYNVDRKLHRIMIFDHEIIKNLLVRLRKLGISPQERGNFFKSISVLAAAGNRFDPTTFTL